MMFTQLLRGARAEPARLPFWSSCTVICDPATLRSLLPERFDHDGAVLCVDLTRPLRGSLHPSSVRFAGTWATAGAQMPAFLEVTNVSPTAAQIDLALPQPLPRRRRGQADALLDALRRRIEGDVAAGVTHLRRTPRESRAPRSARAGGRCPLARR